VKFFGGAGRGPRTNRLDFGGDPITFFPILPQFSPQQCLPVFITCSSTLPVESVVLFSVTWWQHVLFRPAG